MTNMTLEELVGCNSTDRKMETVSEALEELLVAAQRQNCLTVGVYESAQLMNVDPDSVVLCVLATDEEDENDVALQIHFTLIQAFCCDIDINIVRVSGMRRLAQVLGEPLSTDSNANEPRDLHCILVTNPQAEHLKLNEVGSYCKESRCRNQWVPSIALQER
ncbi:growth arrest and DNA damage-inducible protein GADD45 beta-like [Sinocyclocheilus rhinocerous]|uniref:Growth arrest and DNA damage-inducible protein GADD45 beta-like n=1 Tax=Sinocyclocheilus rhinocerous TaxID=307959 RepID=A0A673L2U8_9TELE|nr:PREDICTED: growth arrest and DNA damage-inducible protein GADD45 beta-like [Sinocyclocheilus rhinocerous]